MFGEALKNLSLLCACPAAALSAGVVIRVYTITYLNRVESAATLRGGGGGGPWRLSR